MIKPETVDRGTQYDDKDIPPRHSTPIPPPYSPVPSDHDDDYFDDCDDSYHPLTDSFCTSTEDDETIDHSEDVHDW